MSATRASFEWDQLDWSRIRGNVTRLQARIVKAVQVKDWRRVKALQRFLTRSYGGRAMAVKRVTDNKGRRTPGVDGATWSTSKAKQKAIESLSRRGYQPQPLRRVYIPKAGQPGKERPLGIPTLTDRAMQALHLLALEPISETLADRNSYGFRRGRSTTDAIQQCHTVLSGHDRAQWILEGDIKGCFDHISHDWLVSHVPMDKEILRKWLKAGYIEKGKLFPTEAGTPQGGIISPTLANMTLDGLEAALVVRFGAKGGRQSGRCKVNLIRYADDFAITGSSKELLASEVMPLVEHFLSARGLELSKEKTKITHIQDGFDFLGENVRRRGRKIIITPSKKSVRAIKQRIKEIFHEYRTATHRRLIEVLNPVIRGWANYHRAQCASKTFATIDAWIWRKTWAWARRRHLNKPAAWVKRKYFRTSGQRHWDFGLPALSGPPQSGLALVRASDTRIRRHVKIFGEANPFDPRWALYLAARRRLLARRAGSAGVHSDSLVYGFSA